METSSDTGQNQDLLENDSNLICTFAIWLITFSFALYKLESLILRNDPDMDIVTKEYAFDETEITDLNENRINVAFVIEDYNKKETRGDKGEGPCLDQRRRLFSALTSG